MTEMEFELEVMTYFQFRTLLADAIKEVAGEEDKPKPPNGKFLDILKQIQDSAETQKGIPVTPEELGWDKK